MSNLFKINKLCRLCKSSKLSKIVSIGDSPISEKYSEKKDKEKKQQLVPLDLYLCNDCFHVQLIHVVNPDYLWSNFTFKTSRNKKIENHYEDYVNDLFNFSKKEKKNFILDIGSNDGTLLKLFKDKKIKKVLGIDPAKNVAEEANKNGIQTLVGYMNKENSEKIKLEHGLADIITANNVYAHVNDMDEITKAIKNILKPNGLFVFEVSYLLDVINKKLLGTIFHEHLSYHSVKPLINFFERMNMEIINIHRNDLQGGSIVCYVQHSDGPYTPTENLKKIIELENNSKLNKKETFVKFSDELKSLKRKINDQLEKLIKDKKKISGFGSARSATTLIKYLDISSKINFIVDDNKDKHYKFTPGDEIEVLPTEMIYKNKQDYVIVFAWEHTKKIISNHKKFIESGGKFISLFPDFRIIDQIK